MTREIKADTGELLNDASVIREDTARILAEIARLQEQLSPDVKQRTAVFMLGRYLNNLTTDAESVCDPLLDVLSESRDSEFGSIQQVWTAQTSRPESKAEIPDQLVFAGGPKDLNQIFVDQEYDEQAWGKENQIAPGSISLKSPEPSYVRPSTSTSTSTSPPTSQEILDQLSKAEISGKQSIKQRYVL